MATEALTLNYIINSQSDLNLSFLPFIQDGGLFIPTETSYKLRTKVMLNLQLPSQKNTLSIEGKVVWIIPKDAPYYIFQGVGIQFVGSNAKTICEQIKSNLDPSLEVGGYISGISSDK